MNHLKALLIGILFVAPWIGLYYLPGTPAEPYVVGTLYVGFLYLLGRFLLWVYEINKPENRYHDDW